MTMTSRDALMRYWPLFGLRLATPRLILAPACDDDLSEIVDLTLRGIHDPAAMPFAEPWTDAPRDELIVKSLRHYWRVRAATVADDWTVQFAVRSRGVLLGIQEMNARHFAVARTVHSGSWLGLAHQGRGYGTEMRCAVLEFAFDHLKAQRAESDAFVDNPASLAVSAKLGYVANGETVLHRRKGEAALNRRLVVTPETFRRPPWSVQVAGLDACRASFGGGTAH